MLQKITLTASDCEAFTYQDIVALYCEAMRDASKYEDYGPLAVFKSLYPNEYKRFSAISRKRREIRKSVDAMRCLDAPIYWGTLTYNNDKNRNKEEIKRKEAFEKLNSVFKYVLLVEEYGEENGRFHIHFLGLFRDGEDFNSFKLAWSHSRQELRLLSEKEDIAKYLIKYLIKDLPRLRRNRHLTGLVKRYEACMKADKMPWLSSEKRVKVWSQLSEYVTSFDK